MYNNIATWYTEGVGNKRQCVMGEARGPAVILQGSKGYNQLKAAQRRLDNNDQIMSFRIGNVPMIVYNTSQNVVVSVFADNKDMALEMYSRDPWQIVGLVDKIGLSSEELVLMLTNPERFDKRLDAEFKLGY